MGQAQVFGVGLGLTAYILGLRHAFDADHIAAIDNTTRKFLAEGQRSHSVGFWFALGHSTVVFGLCLLLALGVRAMAGTVTDDGSMVRPVAGFIGTLVSGLFLVLIGVLNLLVLRHILSVVRRMRAGEFDERELERRLDERGLVNRLLRGVTARVRRPAHMYPIGLLFGLGFDTATEVALLVLAGGAAAGQLPWYAILTLPVLFTAGMTLLDGANGYLMTGAYRWAFATPARKVFYNLTITGLSVAVALLIGGIELIGLLVERLRIATGPLSWIAALDLNGVGYAVAGLLLGTWLVAAAWWRFGRVEQRWAVPSKRPS
jgi:high-affinity nickel-transport protein